ncbi:gas vesicle protein [Nocardia huaxiensis]|uniref:gas vesicle protein n=1 Tax=Nocardia huaxiensis TaxID=2755382 RepID=UPI003B8A6B08
MTRTRPPALTPERAASRHPAAPRNPYADREIALIDLIDRVLAGGVVISGDIVLSIAGVDLVHISLRTLISSVASLLDARATPDDRESPRQKRQ